LAVQARGEQLLRETFPSVKVVVDPAVQMERELISLRRASGQPGPTDLETWIDLLASIWAGQPEPLVKLQWDTQGLKLDATQWPAEFIPVIEDYARQHGWQARLEGSTLKLSRSTGAR
jgi:general secretion pathway protein L